MVLRSQAQAEYAAENYGHFGLNLDRYAHFTSPIRRYADLIVHRALITALDFGKDGLTDGEVAKLPGIAQHISTTERRAMLAERETVGPAAGAVPRHQDRRRVRGPDFGRHPLGPVRPAASRPAPTASSRPRPSAQDYYRYVEEMQAMVGDRTGETFRIGDTVQVRLLEAAPVAGALRFELLSEGSRGKPSSGKRAAKRPSRSYGPKGRRR